MRGLAPSCCVEAAHQGWGKKEGPLLESSALWAGLGHKQPGLRRQGAWGGGLSGGCQRKEKTWGLLRLAWAGGPHSTMRSSGVRCSQPCSSLAPTTAPVLSIMGASLVLVLECTPRPPSS